MANGRRFAPRKAVGWLNRRHVSLQSYARLAHYTGALWRSIAHYSGDSGPILPHITHPHTYSGCMAHTVDGPSATREGVESRVKRATPRNQCQAWAWCKKAEKDPYAPSSTQWWQQAALVRIRPTKLSFPNNRMKNAQRQADNNASWCCHVCLCVCECAYVLTLTVIKRKSSNDDWRLAYYACPHSQLLPCFLLPTGYITISCIVICYRIWKLW